MEILFLASLLLITGLTFLLSARFTRRNILFSVFVPEDYTDNTIVKQIRNKYRKRILISSGLATLLFVFIALFTSENMMILSFVILIHVIIISAIFIFKNAYDGLKTKKNELNWMEDVQVVKATDTSLISEDKPFPNHLFILQLVAYIIAFIIVAFNYDKIPETIPTHWGFSGEADGFSKKNLWTVFEVGFYGLFTLAILWGSSRGMKFFTTSINPINHMASLTHNKHTQFNNQIVIQLTSLIMTSMFIIVLVRPVYIHDNSLPNTIINILIVALLLIVGLGLYMQVKEDRKFRKAMKTSNKAPYYNDDNYIWGLIYYNKNDDNVWVPKQSNFGMTLNMAKPTAWFIMFMIVVFPLIPILIMLFMS